MPIWHTYPHTIRPRYTPDASCTLPEDIVQEDQRGSGGSLSEWAHVFEPCRAPGPVESLGCLLILSLSTLDPGGYGIG